MSAENFGPELIEEGGELHNPEDGSDLDRAAAALETMSTQIGELVTQLKKEGTPPAEVSDIDKAGGKAAEVFRAVAEKAMSIAKALESNQMDIKKVGSEAKGIVDALNALCEQYPYPAPQGTYPAPAAQAKAANPGKGLRAIAETAMSLASQLAKDGRVTPPVASSIKKLATDLQKIVSELKIKKAEVVPVLPETFSVEEPETGALAEAVVKVLRQMAENVSTIAKVAETSEEVSETVQTEIGTADALLTAMAEKLPTQTAKSAKLFSTTLSEVAERALTLSRKANESGFRETRALREISNIQKLLEGVAQKYAGVKKAGEFDIGDLSAVLGADRLLNEFEAQLVKHGMISEPPKVEPPVLAAPVIQPAAPPVAPPVEQVAAVVSPAPDQNPEILAKMETMAKQLAELRTIVAKARGTVAAPASAGNDLITEHNDEALLFPENYNSPAYREALAKRAEAEVQS